MKKEDKKNSRCKGEDGYWDRDTTAATDAARASHAVFGSAEEFTLVANGYFADCDAREQLYGEAGLCLWLSEHNRKGRSVASLHCLIPLCHHRQNGRPLVNSMNLIPNLARQHHKAALLLQILVFLQPFPA